MTPVKDTKAFPSEPGEVAVLAFRVRQGSTALLALMVWIGLASPAAAVSFTGLGDLPGGRFSSVASDVSGDGSVVVGASGSEAFRWTSSGGMVGLGDLPGGRFDSLAYGVSHDGSVVVGAGTPFGEVEFGFEIQEAFRWTWDRGMVGLGDLPGGALNSVAFAVSGDGSVVVGQGSGESGYEAFIWDETNGMRSLTRLLVDEFGLDLTGWTLTRASGVSDDGLTVVGYVQNPSGYLEAWIATIPEPSTHLLVAVGLVWLAVMRRKHGRA
jgi:uncharacterized membrane protein